jgi:hypothetical protein
MTVGYDVTMASGARIPTPEGRYGAPRRGQRIALAAAIAAIAVLFLAWLVWAAWHHASTSVSGEVTSFSVVSEHEVQVGVSVDRASGDRVVCTVEARASDHGLVATQDLTVPAGSSGSVQVNLTIRTDREATSADVAGCRS